MIGIIGFGRFGRLMSRYLAQEFNVYAYDIEDKSGAIAETTKTNNTDHTHLSKLINLFT